MICPYCGNEMRQGALCSSKVHIQWKEGSDIAGWAGVMFGVADHLTADEGILASKVPAYFCADCKKMIIDTDIG